MTTVIRYIIVAVAVVAACALLFSLLGVAVFLLPLIGGAFASK